VQNAIEVLPWHKFVVQQVRLTGAALHKLAVASRAIAASVHGWAPREIKLMLGHFFGCLAGMELRSVQGR